MAALHQRQGEHAEALTYYRRVLRWQSDKAVWWMGLGISLEGESRPQEALAAFRAASVLGGLGEDSRRYIGERIAALQQSPR
jgi:MSHA biogenesis protein MshN